MIVSLTQFADSSSGIGALGIDGKALVIQLVTFVLVFLVLKRFAFKPIVKIMEHRRETIEKGVELGQQMQKEKDELEAEVAETLHKAVPMPIKSSPTPQRQPRAIRRRRCPQQSRRLVAQADDRIKQDEARARASLLKDLLVWSEATEAIIDEKVDDKKDADLIDKALRSGSAA